MNNSIIEKVFPDLSKRGYKITSPIALNYNCIAWAAGVCNIWWEPDPFNQYFWPPSAHRSYSLDSYIEAFKTLNYKISSTENYEEGYEKVALFINDSEQIHAARQLESGHWTSKLGQREDIEHFDLKSIEGEYYGKVAVILKRQINKITN